MRLVNDNAAFLSIIVTIGPDNGAFLKDNIDSIETFVNTVHLDGLRRANLIEPFPGL